MSRSVAEWVGKTDDAAVPTYVKDRIFARFGGLCQNCKSELNARLKPEFDHIVALINGGCNAESNLRPLCKPCHGLKTKNDVAEKSQVYQKRANHLGLTAPKHKWGKRRFRARRPQNTATRAIERRTY